MIHIRPASAGYEKLPLRVLTAARLWRGRGDVSPGAVTGIEFFPIVFSLSHCGKGDFCASAKGPTIWQPGSSRDGIVFSTDRYVFAPEYFFKILCGQFIVFTMGPWYHGGIL